MAGPDRPPPAGPRSRQQGAATAYFPPPTGGELRGQVAELAAQPQGRGVGRNALATVGEATQMFEQPTQTSARPPRQFASQQQVPAGARYRQAAAQMMVPRAASLPRRRGRLRSVGVLSVLKMSLAFYVCVFVVVMVAGAVLWNIAEAAGLISKLDKLVRSVFALSNFELHPLGALAWGGAVVGSLCLLGVLVNVMVAVIYNLLADLAGGVRVTIEVEEPSRAASLVPTSRSSRPARGVNQEGL